MDLRISCKYQAKVLLKEVTQECSPPISPDHDKGSHGNPGIYFKYDVSALKVVIKEDRENVASFLIRLCSVIAGIVVICGFINSIAQAVLERLGYLLPQYQNVQEEKVPSFAANLMASQQQAKVTTGNATKTNLLLTNDMLQDYGGTGQFFPLSK